MSGPHYEPLQFWHDRKLRIVDGRLTKKQAEGFLNGQAPDLSYPMDGPDPYLWQEGDQIVLIPTLLSFTVTKLRARAGRWEVIYVLQDHRPLLLGKRAGYTDDPGRAIDVTDTGHRGTEPEAIDPDLIGRTRTDMENRVRTTDELPAEEDRRLERQQLNRLRNTKRQAQARGLDTRDLDTAIEKELTRLETLIEQALG